MVESGPGALVAPGGQERRELVLNLRVQDLAHRRRELRAQVAPQPGLISHLRQRIAEVRRSSATTLVIGRAPGAASNTHTGFYARVPQAKSTGNGSWLEVNPFSA
jgi:hypothetical protein